MNFKMTQIRDFALHLRLNYNFLILSAPFLLGALYFPTISNVTNFFWLFLLLYVFLFGGANAYNSFFDKDTGPIGGLKNPPQMARWMYYASWFLQIIGLCFSLLTNSFFSLFFIFSIILFWLYSGPIFRFKGKPILSFVAIGGTVFNATIMGYIAAGGNALSSNLILGALGVTLIILSMYPFSQAYQIAEDRQRGDNTFTVKYGISGIKKNYLILFLPGIILLSYSLFFNITAASIILVVGILSYFFIWQIVKTISGDKTEYGKVMKTKYFGGVTLTLVLAIILILLRL